MIIRPILNCQSLWRVCSKKAEEKILEKEDAGKTDKTIASWKGLTNPVKVYNDQSQKDDLRGRKKAIKHKEWGGERDSLAKCLQEIVLFDE